MRNSSDYKLPGIEIYPDRSAVCWPHGARLAVALTVDCYSSEAASAHHMVGSTLDFGPTRGVWRLLDCLEPFGVKATFNIAGATAEAHPRLAAGIAERGHEVAVLGYKYEPHSKLGEGEEREAIRRGIAAVEKATGKRPRGWRTPQSRPSRQTLPLLAEQGIVWDNSLRNDEIPYGLEFSQRRLVEIPASGVNDDTSYVGFPYPVLPADGLLSIWLDELDVLYEESAWQASMLLFSLTPGFMGRRTGLSLVEELLSRIKDLDRVWFATCGEVADVWTQNGYFRRA